MLIGFTLRITFSGEEGSVPSIDDIYPGIFPFWHRCVLPSVWIFRQRKLAVMTSQSHDGEYIARVIERFGFVPVRGSSSRGGSRGSLGDAAVGRTTAVEWPSPSTDRAGRDMSPSADPILLARETGVAIVPFYVALDRAWVLNTWDGFMIPKPMARASIRAGDKDHACRPTPTRPRMQRCYERDAGGAGARDRLRRSARR